MPGSLSRQRGVSFETIVVDNGSTDGVGGTGGSASSARA